MFPDPAGALELLEQLHAADAPCLWPKGEPLKIVARAGTSKLNLTIKSAAQWFSATGTLEVDEGRTLNLKQLFALLDASPGSRFLALDDGEFIAPHLLHAEQHRDTERYCEQGQPRRDAAVQHAQERQPNNGHQSSVLGELTGSPLHTHPGQRHRRCLGTHVHTIGSRCAHFRRAARSRRGSTR